MRVVRQVVLIVLLLSMSTPHAWAETLSVVLHDAVRDRVMPLRISGPLPSSCAHRCSVVLFGTGYRAMPAEYAWLLDGLAQRGHMVVALQHDLPDDPPMPQTGSAVRDRGPHWARGSDSLRAVLAQLSARWPQHDLRRVVLIGHSNGGDIAATFARDHRHQVRALVTLDHRRVPVPHGVPLLTLRSIDQLPDPGVLPEPSQRVCGSICVVTVPDTRHDDMGEQASGPARRFMLDEIDGFLRRHAHGDS